MATWDDVSSYLQKNYTGAREFAPGRLTIDVRCDMDGKLQPVSLRHSAMKGSQLSDYVVISSPITERGVGKLAHITARAGLYMLGGVVSDEQFIYLRHASPLANLSSADLDHAVDAIGSCASKIRAWLVGSYTYR